MADALYLCRFFTAGGVARLGLVARGQLHDLTASQRPELATLASWLCLADEDPAGALAALEGAADATPPVCSAEDLLSAEGGVGLLAPLDAQEVWACGVTYRMSREARMRESRSPTIYGQVYEAERPEIFFKATAHRVVGPGEAVGIRHDSTWDVPEPELTLVVTPGLRIVGYTVGNDMSSRDIEGQNPLYLPQAKVYDRCCALGPWIRLAADGVDPLGWQVRCRIHRGGQVVFEGETSTANLNRTPRDLVGALGRCNSFPEGVLVMTGTGIVPPDTFTLAEGDRVEIAIEGIGTLENPVVTLRS